MDSGFLILLHFQEIGAVVEVILAFDYPMYLFHSLWILASVLLRMHMLLCTAEAAVDATCAIWFALVSTLGQYLPSCR